MTDQALLDAAAELGRQHGQSKASWAIDGNTTTETMQRIMRGLEEGDPAILDMCPAPLSGEWADEPTPATVLDTIGIGEEGDTAEDADVALAAYEDAFTTAYWEEVQRTIAYQLA
jgi:hypothetical protein